MYHHHMYVHPHLFENISFQLEQMKDQPYVVNLAHGVNKETNPDHVKQFVDQIKSYR